MPVPIYLLKNILLLEVPFFIPMQPFTNISFIPIWALFKNKDTGKRNEFVRGPHILVPSSLQVNIKNVYLSTESFKLNSFQEFNGMPSQICSNSTAPVPLNRFVTRKIPNI